MFVVGRNPGRAVSWKISELIQLLTGRALRRYLPARGTAGLARSLVSG